MNTRDLLSLSAEDALAEGFARTVVDLAGHAGGDPAALPALRSAARAASLATADGHTCVHLSELPGALEEGVDALRRQLVGSGMVTPAATPENLPLVLDAANRLYLHRYFATEGRLAARLLAFGDLPLAPTGAALVEQRLHDRFGADDTAAPNLQKRAVALAMKQRLAIISGGPGTGKTTTVVQILALHLELDPACRILLAAPTGKAAARLREAVQAGAAGLPDGLRAKMPNGSFTVHRLLDKARNDGGHLACDLLVVDEASMLDLMLADRLLAVLGPETRLILLGDRNQLAAVEAGAVFSEISASDNALASQTVELMHSYRFGADTALGRIATAARRGDVEAVVAGLAGDDPNTRLDAGAGAELDADGLDALVDGYSGYIAALRPGSDDPRPLFAALARFRVLCALREGPRGAAGLNDALARRCRALLAPAEGGQPSSPWFAGRPVLVTRNDALLRLFNGDIGIALPASAGGFVVCFEDAGAPGGFRFVSPARLPPHETALAMTVHKSQGSEFDRVALVLPAKASPVSTRELVYTGITRARSAVAIYAPPEVLRAALATPSRRHSGLGERLIAA